MPNMVQIIKQAATEAVEAGKPVNFTFGTVISTEPLQIRVDQKLILKAPFLILTRNVTDYGLELTRDHAPKPERFTVHKGLKIGETVLMARTQGGQRYIVLDRVV